MRTLSLLLLIGASGCVASLDFDPERGFPCDENQACLPGFLCMEGLCVKQASALNECGNCAADQRCDYRSGLCVAPCEGTVCPSGEVCADGECAAPTSGLGGRCQTDSDCAGAITGCRTDPTQPGKVRCSCFRTAGSADGVCLGLPTHAGDCAACGDEAVCATGKFSGLGELTFCAPPGFRACEGWADCHDPKHPMVCTLMAWNQDPGWQAPGQADPGPAAYGYLPACASAVADATLLEGQPCDLAKPERCETGLCVPAGGSDAICTRPCSDDPVCVGVGESRCTRSGVEASFGASERYDVTRVCGTGPRLGAACDSASGGTAACGTDAPICGRHPTKSKRVCTRPCVDDADCDAARGFRCHAATWRCY